MTDRVISDRASPRTERAGILLAGGTGSRLLPSTTSVSKQLLPVYDKPLVYYPLSILMLAEVREILVITTPRDLLAMQGLLGDGSQWGLEISWAVQPSPRGIPDALLLGADFLQGRPSMLVLGDNVLYGAHVAEQLREAAASKGENATIFAHRVRNPEEFGVVVLDEDGRPLALEEKPESPPSPWAVIGIYLLGADATRRTESLRPSGRGELEIVDLLRTYLEEGCLDVRTLGRGVGWLDTGSPRSLLQAAQFVEALQERQGLLVASPEEIAFRLGYISAGDLERLAHPMRASGYGKALARLLLEED